MDAKMHKRINHISIEKSGQKQKAVFAHQKPENAEKEDDKNRSWSWWHEDPTFFPWLIVMYTVKCVGQLFNSSRFPTKMKKVSVKNVFEERPHENP